MDLETLATACPSIICISATSALARRILIDEMNGQILGWGHGASQGYNPFTMHRPDVILGAKYVGLCSQFASTCKQTKHGILLLQDTTLE
jgi:hypothetical protein